MLYIIILEFLSTISMKWRLFVQVNFLSVVLTVRTVHTRSFLVYILKTFPRIFLAPWSWPSLPLPADKTSKYLTSLEILIILHIPRRYIVRGVQQNLLPPKETFYKFCISSCHETLLYVTHLHKNIQRHFHHSRCSIQPLPHDKAILGLDFEKLFT